MRRLLASASLVGLAALGGLGYGYGGFWGKAAAQTSCVPFTGFPWPSHGCLNSSDLNAVFRNPPTMVAHNAALKALPPTGYTRVARQGFYAPGDGGAALYTYSAAACPSADDGAQVAPQGATGCWLADFAGQPGADIRVWGAHANGTAAAGADDSVPLARCLAFAARAGIPCRIAGGSQVNADDVVLPSSGVLRGDGQGLSILRRRPSSASTTGVLHCDPCAQIELAGLTIDGNKAIQRAGEDTVQMHNYSGLRVRDVGFLNAFSGNGLTLVTSADQTAGTWSQIDDAAGIGNDAYGMSHNGALWHLRVRRFTGNGNGNSGAAFGPSPGDPAATRDTIQYVSIEGGEFNDNAQNGLWFPGHILRYGASGYPIWGHGNEAALEPVVSDVTAQGNGYYGVVMQVHKGRLVNARLSHNNQAIGWAAGCLCDANEIEVVNVTSDDNVSAAGRGFGVELGCSAYAHLRGGMIRGNGYGVNVGCSQNSDIRGATVTGNTIAQIHMQGAEGDGSGHGIAGQTLGTIVAGNRLSCPAGGTAYGVWQYNGGEGIEISGNTIEGCDPLRAVVADANSSSIRDNTVILLDNPGMTGVDYSVDTASGSLVIPDWAHAIGLTGASNFSVIQRFSAAAVGTGISGARITAQGTGYTNNVAVGVTGCTVTPQLTQAVDADGGLTGVRVVNAQYGSGCVHPVLSFVGGTGGAAVAYVGAQYDSRHALVLSAGSGATMIADGTVSGSNLWLAGQRFPATGAAGTGANLRLFAAYGAVTEESRTQPAAPAP